MIYLILSLIVAGVAIIFALQNAAPVQVNFLIWSFQASSALILLVTLALGALIGFLVSMPSSIRSRNEIKSQRKRISDLESSVASQKLKLDEADQKLAQLQKPAAPDNTGEEESKPQNSSRTLWQG
jgi:putative membrane protein